MSPILFMACLLIFMIAILQIVPSQNAVTEAESILVLGFTLIVAYLFGRRIKRYHLPKITGYLLIGILLGPNLANILSSQAVSNLQLIDNIALSLIALTAGGEFRLEKIRQQLRLILNVTFWQVMVVMTGMTLVIWLYQSSIPFLESKGAAAVLGVGLIFGVLSIATSPATTIAVITETRAKGRFTDFVFGITILKDVIIVLLFAVILSLTKPLILSGQSLQFEFVLEVMKEIMFSLLIGILVGYSIYLYIRFVKAEVFLFLLGLFLLIIELSYILHLEIILIFMMAGFLVQNFSNLGEKLIQEIENNSLSIYVIFFAITGASLKLNLFLEHWLFTLIIVLARIFTTHMGTWIGGRLLDASSQVKRLGWMGFVAQAGLTLGLCVIVERTLPAPLGTHIKTIIIAAIAFNQIAGPILFRYALGSAGEIPEMAERA